MVRASGGKGEVKKANDFVMIHIHLPASEDKTLLYWWNARLLLDFLLDPGDLQRKKSEWGANHTKRQRCMRDMPSSLTLSLGSMSSSIWEGDLLDVWKVIRDEGNLPLYL